MFLGMAQRPWLLFWLKNKQREAMAPLFGFLPYSATPLLQLLPGEQTAQRRCFLFWFLDEWRVALTGKPPFRGYIKYLLKKIIPLLVRDFIAYFDN
jgi:hypothetical protein